MTYEELIKIGYECYPDDGDYKHPVTLHNEVCEKEYPEHQERCDAFGITKEEYFAIVMLEGWDYDIIQRPLFTKTPNEFQSALIDLLDSALAKLSSTSSTILYRQEKHQDIEHLRALYKTGEPLLISNFLTCSTDNFDNTNLILEITPLPLNSRARDIFLVRNHGEELPNPENQVEFMRNTSFLIDEILEPEPGKYMVRCHELSQL